MDRAEPARPDLSAPASAAPLELWAGAECTIARIGDRYVDQAALAGHNARADDPDRFAALGIAALRYPLLWETFAAADDPERLWAWHDARLARLRTAGVRPIVGLIHHGSGPPTTNLLAPDFAAGLADHAGTAARRYPWVRDWTPVNEPLTTARFAALYGHWYPHHRDEAAFWSALITQIEAIAAAMREIRRTIAGARLIQTEDLGYTRATPLLQRQADFDNQRRWASWDMLAGRFTRDHPLYRHVAAMGLGARLDDLAARPCPPDVLGLNHYLTSDRFLDHRLERHPNATHGDSAHGRLADVALVREGGAAPGLEGAVRACWQRYAIPIALTEIHNGCTREEQLRWLAEAWQIAGRLRHDGIALAAVTVWSLLGAHDWDSLLTRAKGSYESGVFDVRGPRPRETALAPMIRQIAGGAVPDHPVLGRAGWWRGHAERGLPGRRRRPLLIAGATGTLGQAFAGACRLRGIDHVLTGRARLDLIDSGAIAAVLDDVQPWAVINCAGWVRVDEAEAHREECLTVNLGGNLALAAACAARGIHYTCFSSDLVFDGEAGRAYVEGDALSPLNVYGQSKALADTALLARGEALVVRTASFFSPYDPHNFAAHLVSALRAERPFVAVADCITSPTYVPDLVRVTLDLIIDGEVGLWHLVNDGEASWWEFGLSLGEALDLPLGLIEPRPQQAMGWCALRPGQAPLTSSRGVIMPSLDSAIRRFAEVLETSPA